MRIKIVKNKHIAIKLEYRLSKSCRYYKIISIENVFIMTHNLISTNYNKILYYFYSSSRFKFYVLQIQNHTSIKIRPILSVTCSTPDSRVQQLVMVKIRPFIQLFLWLYCERIVVYVPHTRHIYFVEFDLDVITNITHIYI